MKKLILIAAILLASCSPRTTGVIYHSKPQRSHKVWPKPPSQKRIYSRNIRRECYITYHNQVNHVYIPPKRPRQRKLNFLWW